MSKSVKEWLIIGGITIMAVFAGFSVDMNDHFMTKVSKFLHTDISAINKDSVKSKEK